MPQSKVVHEDLYKLPKDTPFPGVLNSVVEKTIPYTDRDGKPASFTKWVWEFEVTDGEYMGLRAWADTEPRITDKEGDLGRAFVETLRGKPVELGEGVDTDDYLGLPCVFTVDNKPYEKKNGEISYTCPVQDIYPADAMPPHDPPF